MDPNKRQKLVDIAYSIQRVCSNCRHSNIGGAASWGTCSILGYEHLKHGETRALSIHRDGHCSEHDWRDSLPYGLFDEFREA